MGIYDREYIRRDGPRFLGSLGGHGQVCKWLILINIVVFVLQLMTGDRRNLGPITEGLWLDVDKVMAGQVWRLLTYAFLHDREALLHIVFNMLFLWWFGHEVENIYGGKEFLAFYLAAALISSLAYVLWQLVVGAHGSALGASGAVSAVVVLVAINRPLQAIAGFGIVALGWPAYTVFASARRDRASVSL